MDTPFWVETSVGPRFEFTMKYDSRDSRALGSKAWPTGYKWHNPYDCRVLVAGNDYFFDIGGGRGYRFTKNDAGVFVEAPGSSTYGWGGAFRMGTNGAGEIVIWKRGGGQYEFVSTGGGVHRLKRVRDRRGAALELAYVAWMYEKAVKWGGRGAFTASQKKCACPSKCD